MLSLAEAMSRTANKFAYPAVSIALYSVISSSHVQIDSIDLSSWTGNLVFPPFPNPCFSIRQDY